MKRFLCTLRTVAAVAGFASLASSALGDVIYANNNTNNDLAINYDIPAGYSMGNEIVLDQGNLGARRLTSFEFQYFATNAVGGETLAGNVGVTLALYQNNGPLYNATYATPQDLIWQSSLYTVADGLQGGRHVLQFTSADFGGNLWLPSSNMTFAVSFSNLGAGDHAGLTVYGGPPSVGNNFNDRWQWNGTDWQLWDGGTNSFAVQVEATPEPATLWLVGAGGLLGFVMVRRRLRA
jgi:hypothetical protein